MFDKLFRRQQEQPPEQAPPTNPNPFISLELDLATNTIKAYAHFPQPLNRDGALTMAKNVAIMTFLLNDGRLLHVLQQAIAVGGVAAGLELVGQTTLQTLNDILGRAAVDKAEQDSGPLIRPTHAFSSTRPDGATK